MINRDNFLNIQGWMVLDLGLSGNSLLIYSIIYGFSQCIDEQSFNGTLSYLCEWTKSTKQGVLKNIKSLIDKGLIEKKERIENGVKKVEYYATKFNGGIKQSLTGGIKQSLPNDNINIINNIINNNIQDEEVKKEFLKYVDYRKERKSPLTKTSIEYAINKLNEVSNNEDCQKVEIIKQSIENGWLGLFPLKEKQRNVEDEDEHLTADEWLDKYVYKGAKHD